MITAVAAVALWWGVTRPGPQAPQGSHSAAKHRVAEPPVNPDAGGRAVDTPARGAEFTLHYGLKDEFDGVLFAHEGLAEEEVIDHYRSSLAPQQLNTAALAYATDLFARYIAYKKALVTLDVGSHGSVREMTARLSARDDMRQRRFSADEYHYLFSRDTAYDNAALARIRIAADTALSKQDRQRLITEQLTSLPEDQQQSFAPSLSVNRIATLQRQYQNEEALFHAVAAEFGEDVAQRLADQMREDAGWHQKINAYSALRQQILADSALSAEEQQQQLRTHQQRLFTGPERRRVQVYLENPALLSAPEGNPLSSP